MLYVGGSIAPSGCRVVYDLGSVVIALEQWVLLQVSLTYQVFRTLQDERLDATESSELDPGAVLLH